MKTKLSLLLLAVFAIGLMAVSSAGAATYIKKADNFIVLLDTSGSMNEQYMNTGKSKMALSKELLAKVNSFIPDLDFISGLYTFTPWKDYYEMKQYDQAAYGQAIASLPEPEPGLGFGSPTPLRTTFIKTEDLVKPLDGRTVIIVFSDGRNTEDQSAVPMAARLAKRYDVCFLVVSTATTSGGKKTLDDIAALNSCSRVVDWEYAIDHPEVIYNELFSEVPEEVVIIVPMEAPTVEETPAATTITAKVETVHFAFDKVELNAEATALLDSIGAQMQADPESTLYVAGYTDSTGPADYNWGLSERRAASVASYVMDTYGISSDRMTVRWYGQNAPIDSNETAAGRAQNRRAEIILIESK